MIRNITPVIWRTDHPEINRPVYVWWLNQTIKALWDGQLWRTLEGYQLDEVTHWRPLRD